MIVTGFMKVLLVCNGAVAGWLYIECSEIDFG